MTTKSEKQFLDLMASTGCAVCWRLYGPHEPGPIQIHHPRGGVAMGKKAGHLDAIPLCGEHHQGKTGVHGLGTKGFPAHYGFTEADLQLDTKRRMAEQMKNRVSGPVVEIGFLETAHG